MLRGYWRWRLSGDPASVLGLLDDRVAPLVLFGPLAWGSIALTRWRIRQHVTR
jgi:hypothetical protein